MICCSWISGGAVVFNAPRFDQRKTVVGAHGSCHKLNAIQQISAENWKFDSKTKGGGATTGGGVYNDAQRHLKYADLSKRTISRNTKRKMMLNDHLSPGIACKVLFCVPVPSMLGRPSRFKLKLRHHLQSLDIRP